MNTQKLEQLLLLEQSGELSPKQRRQLDAELAASAEARQARNELRGLAAAILTPAAPPATTEAARIGARLQQASKPAVAFLPAWKPAFAAAAALALLLGVRTYHAHQLPVASESAVASSAAEVQAEEWTDPLDAEFTELESLIETMSSADLTEITEI